MLDIIISPSEFIGLTNQTLEHAMPYITIEGEIADLRVSKGKWLYFKVKDDKCMVNCFGVVYMMPGPLENGMVVKVAGTPRMHDRFGFSFNAQSITPSGEGAINKAFELLKQKLLTEGLFEQGRKRRLEYPPNKIAVVTSAEGAAIADFTKILNVRWPYVEVSIYDSLVQGQNAPNSLVCAINASQTSGADVLVVTRGGGGAEDLAAFNDERVVRAIAASRIPTMVAIGHETDDSLSEQAADSRASTPSNAAELLTPNRADELSLLQADSSRVSQSLEVYLNGVRHINERYTTELSGMMADLFGQHNTKLGYDKQRLELLSPKNVLKRGYSLIYSNDGKLIHSRSKLDKGQIVELKFYNGTKQAEII